ncbi:transposase [Spongiactinospora gelatinilytica]|uniref:transposase n=1 Tax=Spongiactinospora gelatinilytica TaxID=2666298 RepID=UPI001314B782|nr:transposase [Spongiactinospora gelatinilytica]
MAARDIVPVIRERFQATLASVSPDVMRALISAFTQQMMDAEVDRLCGAAYGQVHARRMNSRNGYRWREWDTRAGTVELAIPRVRFGTYYPRWLLDHLGSAERTLADASATSYLLGVSVGRVERLADALGLDALSRLQITHIAREMDELVDDIRNRPLSDGLYTFLWLDAVSQQVEEDGRTVELYALIAIGAKAQEPGGILGVDIVSDEADIGWLMFLRGLRARGLRGVRLVVCESHTGLREAIASAFPEAWTVPPGALRRAEDCAATR